MNIVFLIFRRPAHTRQVFDVIRSVKPARLLIVADGPRHDADRAACAAARAVVETIDWPCDVLRNYSTDNLGCRRRVQTGLDWVFSHVEEAIILEDDCLPDPTFFPYCMELLERYRNDTRVMHIGGVNLQNGIMRGSASYYFSKYNHVWGWATWRRAWALNDATSSRWNSVNQDDVFHHYGTSRSEMVFWNGKTQRCLRDEVDTWDFPWLFSMWQANGLAILPQINLVHNIGFGSDATHTTQDIPLTPQASSMSFPLRHPQDVQQHRAADTYSFINHFATPRPSLFARMTNRWFYGALIRKIPVIGTLWAGWMARGRDQQKH